MGSQLFKVLSTRFITMNVIIKSKMSHVKQNHKRAKMKASSPCNEGMVQMTTFEKPHCILARCNLQ